MTSRGRDDGYTQIGHGGYEAFGDHHGNVTVEARNGITMTGTVTNTGADRGYAQIGHGGYDAEVNDRQKTAEGLGGTPNTLGNDPDGTAVPAGTIPSVSTGTWYNQNIYTAAAPVGMQGSITVRAGVDSLRRSHKRCR